MYPDADIKSRGATGEAHDVYLVTFDPIPQEWYEEEGNMFDPMEHLIRLKWLEAIGPEFKSELSYWMEISKHSHWVQEADEATDKAVELGWESW